MSIEMEKAVLACCLLDEGAADLAVQELREEDFGDSRHRLLFRVLVDFMREDKRFEPVAVREFLNSTGEIERIGEERLMELATDTLPSSANIEVYIKAVKKSAQARDISIIARQMLSLIQTKEPEEVVSWGASSLYGVFEKGNHKLYDATALNEMVVKKDMESAEVVCKTGLREFDKRTRGLSRGRYVILAGRPSMGKTALSIAVANNLVASGVPVLYFSVEMRATELFRRMACMNAEVDSQAIGTDEISEEDKTRYYTELGRLGTLPLYIDESSFPTTLHVRLTAKRMMRQKGVKVIFVDYITLIRHHDTKNKSRHEQVAEISAELKAIAKDLEIPVIALSQLNREMKDRAGDLYRPHLWDLRESGALEQDADIVLFIHRLEQIKKKNVSPEWIHRAEITIEKNRSGPTGRFNLHFDARTGAFREWMREDETEHSSWDLE